MLIIHAPSDTLDFYRGGDFRDSGGYYYSDHPALFSPPPSSNLAASALQREFGRDPIKEPDMPVLSIEGSFNCEDVYPATKNYTANRAPRMQNHAIQIVNDDIIADGHNVLEALRAHHISNVIVMGVHTNLYVGAQLCTWWFELHA